MLFVKQKHRAGASPPRDQQVVTKAKAECSKGKATAIFFEQQLPSPSSTSSTPVENQELAKQVSALTNQLNQLKQNAKRKSADKRILRKCYICGLRSHFARDCTEVPNRGPPMFLDSAASHSTSADLTPQNPIRKKTTAGEPTMKWVPKRN